MQKIIVTGGLGFIGSNLIKILLKKNYSVINLDKNQLLPTKGRVKLMPNETIKMSHGGRGGFGPACNRKRNQIEIDLKNGLISHEIAKKIYKFV